MTNTSALPQQPKNRQSNFELLRIIAMIMIIFHHFASHGGFEWQSVGVTVPHLWNNFIIMGGKIGVNIFVLISGYFLISDNKKPPSLRRILKIIGQLVFYSIAILIVFSILGIVTFDMESLIRAFFPLLFTKWWFASTYFVLYLIHPFLNIALRNLDKKTYQILLVMLIIMWSIIPTFTNLPYQGNNLLWFVTLYTIAGYIRIHGLNPSLTSKHYFFSWLIISVLTYVSSVLFTILGSTLEIFASHETYFYGQEKITTLLISLTLFMLFDSIQMNYHKWINVLASATFGVYLIHDSDNHMQKLLWIDLFHNPQYQNSLWIIPYSIFSVIIVYVICTIIDLVRQKVFEKPYLILVDKCMGAPLNSFNRIGHLVKDFIFGQETEKTEN